MDDGSIKSKESKGVILNTHSFSLHDVELLCSVLKTNFNLIATPLRQTHKGFVYYQIYFSGHSFEQLSHLILPHLIPEMLYKFPSPRKLRNFKDS
jgi:hypothetical protein